MIFWRHHGDEHQRPQLHGRTICDGSGRQFAGWISSIEGGHATSDVVVEKLGADMIQHKHLAGVKYEDITVNCGTAMSKAFYSWIQASLDRKHARNDGAIITADYDQKEVGRLDFFHALITEVGFPALDAASKDAAKMTVKFAPEYTRMKRQDRRCHRGADRQGRAEEVAALELPSQDRRSRSRLPTRQQDRSDHDQAEGRRGSGRRAARLSEGAGEHRVSEPRHHLRRVARRRSSTSGTRTSSSRATTVRTRKRAARSST